MRAISATTFMLYSLVEALLMIQDHSRWQAFENAWVASQRPDHAQNLRLVDGMYQLARRLGQFKDADALEGIEKNIRLVDFLS